MMWKKLVEFLFPNPSMCVLCETKTERLTICPDCLARWQRLTVREGQCQRCGHFGTRAAVCDTCRSWPRYYHGNMALLPYTETVSEAIRRFKYHQEPWRIEGFAPLFEARPAPDVTMIVPVPLHEARLRERGYNQSLLLARAAGEVWHLPVRDEVLARIINTRHQVELPRAQRLTNVAGAFAVPARAKDTVKGARILLVDDVMTTGSTLLACARALHEAGAASVESVTLAAGIR